MQLDGIGWDHMGERRQVESLKRRAAHRKRKQVIVADLCASHCINYEQGYSCVVPVTLSSSYATPV